MTYRNILLCLDPAPENDRLLRLAAELAAGLEAHIVGCAARRLFPATYSENLAAVTQEIVAEGREYDRKEMEGCEARFRAAMQGWVQKVDWRSTLSASSVPDWLATQARCCDLIVINPDARFGDNAMSPAELAMRAGRPVLVAPPELSRLDLRRAVIAWKDTREARRAVADALPLLKLAKYCTIVEITSTDEVADGRRRLDDVAAWLASHGVSSEILPVGTNGPDSVSLAGELRRLGPDLVVAGVYGHSRLSEWVFGGVTRDVLLRPESCVLISH